MGGFIYLACLPMEKILGSLHGYGSNARNVVNRSSERRADKKLLKGSNCRKTYLWHSLDNSHTVETETTYKCIVQLSSYPSVFTVIYVCVTITRSNTNAPYNLFMLAHKIYMR